MILFRPGIITLLVMRQNEYFSNVRERETQRETQRETERERETDRQTDRQRFVQQFNGCLIKMQNIFNILWS